MDTFIHTYIYHNTLQTYITYYTYTHREAESGREAERDQYRDSGGETDRESDSGTERYAHADRTKETERHRQSDTGRQGDRETERYTTSNKQRARNGILPS